MESRSRRALLVPLAVNIVLPLAVYYILRAQGAAQWQALLLSSVVPAVHALGTAVLRRRLEFFDLFVVGLLAVSAATSLISGNPRVLLLKDAALPALLGLWILATLLAARPFAFRFGERLRTGAAVEDAERAWQEMPEYRSALRGLTTLWGCVQLLDAALSTVLALTLPVDVVPLVGRIQSFTLLGLVIVATVRRSRRFRAQHGRSLFGTGGPGNREHREEAPSRV
ncbi:VC0807 family protein [Streptomyces olivoreticuli]